jgi:anti-sigma B factor antagonist
VVDGDARSSNPDLTLRVEQNGHGPVLHVKGEVDMATAPELRQWLDELDGTVVADLSEVGFLDSTGITAFIIAHKRLRADGGVLTLRNPSSAVAKTLEIVGLHDWIEHQRA